MERDVHILSLNYYAKMICVNFCPWFSIFLSQIVLCILTWAAHNRFANANEICGGKTAVCDSEV